MPGTQGNPLIKRGIALTPVKFGISFNATLYNQAGALVNVYTDGTVLLNHGGTEMGQGLHTKVAQVVATEFGLPLSAIRVTTTDTSKVPNTSATAASSGSDLNGKAAQAAAQTIRGRLVEWACRATACIRIEVHFVDGHVHVGSAANCLRRVRAPGASRAHLAVIHRLLPHAEDPLGSRGVPGPTVLLFRVWRGGR